MLFPLFKQALEQQKNIKVLGNGTNLIPMIHVDDVCSLANRIAFSEKENSGYFFGIDHSLITQKDLIETIAKNMGNG